MTATSTPMLRAAVTMGAAVGLLLSGLGTTPTHGAPPAEEVNAIVTPLTNLAHLNFLGDTVAPPEQEGHSTYRLDEEPELGVLWTYADARDGGPFERVGGGPYDEVTDTWGQGAFNTDDLTRAAVVYLRHWQNTGDENSRQRAYQLLRGVTYMQTITGENAGNVVLWMQPDGGLNLEPEPVELPDPSDSDESYWLARTVWALGEGHEAFAEVDPAFASFLQDRIELSLTALERSSLSRYGQYDVSDGVRVPAWLIVDGSDATAEAALGLAAYVRSAPEDSEVVARAESALERYAEGIAAMSAGEAGQWPFGSVVQWTHSRSLWHAWSSQMPAALAQAADALGTPAPAILEAALTDAAVFTPYLLTSTGMINGWQPSPTDLTQIAYGIDSRLQSLLTVADVTDEEGFHSLAGMTAAWYFGANRAGKPLYNPQTGVTFDGLQANGDINMNSGAESAIHGLLSMIALDENPEVATAAQTMTTLVSLDGVAVAEAEAGTVNDAAETMTPESSWTGESAWSGGAYLSLSDGAKGTWDVPLSDQPRLVLPVVNLVAKNSVDLEFFAGEQSLGRVDVGSGGAQGVTEVPGSLVPVTLADVLPAGATSLSAVATGDGSPAELDAVLLIPVVSRLVLRGDGHETVLLHNATTSARSETVTQKGTGETNWSSHDRFGKLIKEGVGSFVALEPQGFAVVRDAPAVTPTPSVSATPTESPSVEPSTSPSTSKTPTASPSATQKPTTTPSTSKKPTPRPTSPMTKRPTTTKPPGLPSTGD